MKFHNRTEPLDELALKDDLRADRGDGMPDTLYKINELLYLLVTMLEQQGQQLPEPPKDPAAGAQGDPYA